MLAVTNCRGEIFGVCVDARSEARTRTSSQPLAGARLSGPRAGVETSRCDRARACASRSVRCAAGRGSALAPPPRLPPSGTSPRFRAVGPRRAPRRARITHPRALPQVPRTHTHTPRSSGEKRPAASCAYPADGNWAGCARAHIDARESDARCRAFRTQLPTRAQSTSGAGHHGFTGHPRLLQRSGQRASRALATRAAGSRALRDRSSGGCARALTRAKRGRNPRCVVFRFPSPSHAADHAWHQQRLHQVRGA